MTSFNFSLLAHPRAVVAACVLAMAPMVYAQSGVSAFHEVQAEAAQKDGVPLSALAANAPDSYTVKRGDTLWAISGMFLKSPWRWPQLWGMNKSQIRNPHLIYPGQVLYLDRSNGRARLRMGQAVGQPSGTVRLSPQVRSTSLKDDSIKAIPSSVIGPFLAEMITVNQESFLQAPRVVAAPETKTLMVQGDRAYVRAWRTGDLRLGPDQPKTFRIYRNAEPLKDPETGRVLAYEAHYLGRADLVRPAGTATVNGKIVGDVPVGSPVSPLENVNRPFNNGEPYPDSAVNEAINPVTEYPYNLKIAEKDIGTEFWREAWRSNYKGTFDNKLQDEENANIIPATIDIVQSREEIRIGDRLAADLDVNALAEYVPQAAPEGLRARIVSVYSGEVYAGQNQIVAINRGANDGLERGSVLSILTKGELMRDRTDPNRPLLRLPNEVNGHIMVFSVFDQVSYALLLGVKSPVSAGDFAIDPLALENEMIEE